MLNENERDGMKAVAMALAYEAMMEGFDEALTEIHFLIADGRHGDAHMARLELEQMLQETMDLVEDATLQLSPESKRRIIEHAIEVGFYSRPGDV
jgi:alpha-D-ribose 1-methylphosphonate 5-triphosphate synthase subunit PhnI